MWEKIEKIESKDENVLKYVFTKKDAVAEAVLYKYPTYKERTVICCSTQSGCAVGCRFCGAGDHFVRSLTEHEILSQVIYLLHDIDDQVLPEKIEKLQIMFMSMGEPMNNFENVARACRIFYGKWPHAKLLISTSAPRNFAAFEELNVRSKLLPSIGLQFSVHESTDEARAKLIPSPTMTLKEMAATGLKWHQETKRRPFINYCVHPGNNTQDDVDRLKAVFDPTVWEATLSVICERTEHMAAANERQRKLATDFSALMLTAGYNVRVFNPAGQDDIGGGCGQLWYVQDWMKKNPTLAKPTKGHGLPSIHTPKAEHATETSGNH